MKKADQIGMEEAVLARDAAGAYPAPDTAPESLRRRVSALAAEHGQKAARRERARRTLRLGAVAATVAGLAALAAVVGPRVPAAYALRRMASAVRDARSAHTVMWRLTDDGTRVRYGETWYEAGKWRMESPDRLLIHRDGRNFTRLAGTDLFLVQDAPRGPAAFNSTGFSVGAMVRDQARWGWKTRVESLGVGWRDGRLARSFLVHGESGSAQERSVIWADARTDLPFRREHQVRTPGGTWETRIVTDAEYDVPAPPGAFVLPPGGRAVDRAEARREWAARLSKGLARAKVRGREIVIRDVSVNRSGDVFVLYTAGKRVDDARNYGQRFPGRDWAIWLSDDRGTQYVWQQSGDLLQATYVDNGMPGSDRKMEVDGERLEGDWFTPVRPTQGPPWPGRRLTVGFRVAAENTHGAPPNGETNIEEAKLTERADLSVRVAAPVCDVLPAYMPFVPGGFFDPYEVRKEAALARAFWYRHERGTGYDWEKHGDGPPDRPYLEKALFWYREALRIGEEAARERGDEYRDGGTMYEVSRMLRLLGRGREADEALREAKRLSPQSVASRETLDRTLDEYRAKEGLGPLNR